MAMMDPELDRVQKLARVLDHNLVDPLIGFVLPGVGDLAGSVLGLYTVVLAVRRRLSPVIVARMLMNLALDAAFGVIPLVGDLFDLGFKANTRNLALLSERSATGGRATAKDWLTVAGAALMFGLAIGLAIYTVARLVGAVASWL
ncbi:MAG: DUF4112 domain-containing protein [Myxococcales bacterium]|nr:DUF4112 domain-containing protein [Myxococcales bacterium]